MKQLPDAVRLPPGDESIGAVTIRDAQGRVVRVVSAAEFRRDHPPAAPALTPPLARRRRRREAGRDAAAHGA